MSLNHTRTIFVVAGLYDLLIGLAFVFNGPQIFESTGVPAPNHWGYVHFAALLLIIFGLMFFAIAFNPRVNRNLMPYGILLKAAYSGLVFFYWANGDVPGLFKPFAIIDVIMLVLFVVAYARSITS